MAEVKLHVIVVGAGMFSTLLNLVFTATNLVV